MRKGTETIKCDGRQAFVDRYKDKKIASYIESIYLVIDNYITKGDNQRKVIEALD
mgnify:CR=1 FL=1